MYLPIILALIVAITYFLSNKWNIKKKHYAHKIYSFSAAVSITYVLLELFPIFTERVIAANKLIFLSVVFGFIIHHLIEKHIYQIHRKSQELIKSLSFEENTFSFIYHIIIGILLVSFLRENVIQGVLFFIPVISFVFVSTLPTDPHPSKAKSFLLSSSTLIGVLFATFFLTYLPLWLETTLIGFVLGVMLFTVIRHHIPFGKKGKIGYFTLGFVLYSVLIIISWYL